MTTASATKIAYRLAALAALAGPLPALAADDGHGHEKAGILPTIEQGVVPAFVSLIVFGVVFAVLAVFVWPKIGSALKDREQKIRDEIDAAEMARKQAKDALEQYQQSLAQARAEAQKEIDKARAQAQIIGAELKAKADAELSQMREKAMRDIEGAKRAAVAEVSTHATNLAAAMAGKILKREVSAGDTQRLVEESMAQLSGSRN
jgi:F-type H+-transporting ATPase subunit b